MSPGRESHNLLYPTSVSSIKDVKPVESKQPRHLNIVFDSNDGIVDSTVEFDTDESAQDWRRELLGAFLSRPSHPRGDLTLPNRCTVLVSQGSPCGFDR
jgi:hypothetical protein